MAVEFWSWIGMGLSGALILWAVVTLILRQLERRRKHLAEQIAVTVHVNDATNERVDELVSRLDTATQGGVSRQNELDSRLRGYGRGLVVVQEGLKDAQARGRKAQVVLRVEALEEAGKDTAARTAKWEASIEVYAGHIRELRVAHIKVTEELLKRLGVDRHTAHDDWLLRHDKDIIALDEALQDARDRGAKARLVERVLDLEQNVKSLMARRPAAKARKASSKVS